MAISKNGIRRAGALHRRVPLLIHILTIKLGNSVVQLQTRRPLRVCAVQRRRFPVGARPTRQTLQPEATGAAMEVTKWLKPSDSASRIGDGASVQAVTRVNAEQASKRTMRRPTRRPFRGRLIRLGEV